MLDENCSEFVADHNLVCAGCPCAIISHEEAQCELWHVRQHVPKYWLHLYRCIKGCDKLYWVIKQSCIGCH